MGGGTLLIPLLVFWGGMSQRSAQGTNLLAYLPSAALALWAHSRSGRVEKEPVKTLCLWGLFGALIGTGGAFLLNEQWLRRIFGGFIALLGILQLLRSGKKTQ